MKEFYLKCLTKGNDVHKNGWNSRELAIKRYMECGRLIRLLTKAEKIYDYGCGTANLNQFVVDMNYIGLDELPEMVDAAYKIYPDVEVYCNSLEKFDVGVYGKMSVGVANGIYMVGPNETRQDVFNRTIDNCVLLANRHYFGFMFNSKHNMVDYHEDHHVYYDLGKLLAELKKVGLKVSLFLFEDHEFFLYCRK